MTSRVQTLRSSVAGARPFVNTRAVGEIYVNYPDIQLGVIDTTRTAIDLIPIRYFSTLATYSIGDYTWHSGMLYRAIATVLPGAFNANQWTAGATIQDLVNGYMPLAGGTFTGPITTTANSNIVGYLKLAGGTMTGPLVLVADPTVPLGAATKQYVDTHIPTGSFLPLVGGTMTGPINFVDGNTINGAAGTTRSMFGQTNGVNRWQLVMCTNLAETGANSGSNFGLISYDDSGAPLSSWNFNRATMRLTMNGNGATAHSLTTYPPMPGSSTIVLNKAGSTHFSGIVSSSNGLNRINIAVSDATSEAGSNSGSDFNIQTVGDDGLTQLASININRANGRLTSNAVGATPHSLTTYPPKVGSSTVVLNKAGSGQDAAIVASSNGLNRWALDLANATTETGGGSDSGSDFNLGGFKDDGITATASLNILRANGRVTLNAVGATPHSLITYPPQVGGATIVLNKAAAQNCAIVALSNGLNRWALSLGDSTVEAGGNSGSDFNLIGYADNGTANDASLNVNRANGRVSMNAVGATPRSNTQYPPQVGGANFITNAAIGGGCSYIGARNGLNRWQVVMDDGSTETGANAGSNFFINSYNDAGVLLAQPMGINRATARVTFAQPIINGSDKRMKSNIQPVTDALAIIEKLQGVYYKHKDAIRRQVGLIAQDVAPALPEVVFETGAFEDKEPELGIAYSNIVAVLINAVKELAAKVEALEGGSVAPKTSTKIRYT